MPNPTVPTITGQTLIDLANTNLGGLANSITGNQLLSFLNEGKDELWGALKQVNQKFFVTSTQATDASQPNYFAPLVTTTREYSLPTELRDILFIEVTLPSTYEKVRFTRKSMLHPEFRNIRTSATADHAQGSITPIIGAAEYLYDVVGKGTFVIAQFPEVAFTLQIWYVRALPEILQNAVVDEIVFPFSKKLVDYAVMKIMMVKDPANFSLWKSQWRDDVISTLQSSDRSSADPIFAADFFG